MAKVVCVMSNQIYLPLAQGLVSRADHEKAVNS